MKNVLLFLANGFEIYEASVFIDVFGWNMIHGNKNARVTTCGFTPEIKSTFGLTLKPDIRFETADVKDYDALAIPGGFEDFGFYVDAYDPRFLDLIRSFHAQNKVIASICVGALPVGKSGILKDKRATTFQGARQAQLKEFGAIVMNEPLVVEGNIITSWNPSTAVNVAFKLLERLTSF